MSTGTFAATATAQVAALRIPAPLRIQYSIASEIRGFSLPAQGELRWKHDGASYDMRLDVGAALVGSRVQTSRGRITAAGLVPRRFSDSERSEAIEFDEQPFQARPRADRPPVPLAAGTQDGASVFVQLGMLVGSAPQQFPAGTVFNLPVISRRKPVNWRLAVGGEESLRLGDKSFDTIKLTRLKDQPEDPETEVWLAPALGWLPARIRLRNGKDYIDQRWRSDSAP